MRKVFIIKGISKGSGKPAHKCSLTTAFAVVETFWKLQAEDKSVAKIGTVHAHLKNRKLEKHKVLFFMCRLIYDQ